MKTNLVAYYGRIGRTCPAAPSRGIRKNKEFQLSPSKYNRRFALLLSCFLLLCVAAWGAVAGSISGVVKDSSGSVVPKASVTVRELSTGILQQTHTNGDGYFTFPVLPVGRYELRVQALGFQGYLRKDIAL